jgi:nitrogen fixation protein NifB
MQRQDFITREHPCFGACKPNKGRIHLPVSPGCNIECRFCSRKINETEQRPGVTSAVIKPEDTPEIIREAIVRCPEITVVGIAGPGDTLATDYALKTFRIVKKEFPHLLTCMSTNGLLLSEKADEIITVGIDTLTVTVNSVDPETEAKINKRICWHGKIYDGTEGAEILISNQLEGIHKICSAGILVKINTVLVPGINDMHIEETAAAVAEAGATIFNIIPLIPQNEFSQYPAPTCQQLDKARTEAGRYIDVFRHCAHCRADAIGVPGVYDIGSQIYLKRIAEESGLHLAGTDTTFDEAAKIYAAQTNTFSHG